MTELDDLDEFSKLPDIAIGSYVLRPKKAKPRSGPKRRHIKRDAEIVSRYCAGETQESIGKRFGITQGAVSSVLKRWEKYHNRPGVISLTELNGWSK